MKSSSFFFLASTLLNASTLAYGIKEANAKELDSTEGLRGADRKNENRELFAPMMNERKTENMERNGDNFDLIMQWFNQWAEHNKETNKHARIFLEAQEKMGNQQRMLDEWESEHEKMLHWARKLKFTGASGERNLIDPKSNDLEDKVTVLSQKNEDRELPWVPPNRWEAFLDKWGGAGYIYADICVGTEMRNLLQSWCNANEATNAFARLWKELCFS